MKILRKLGIIGVGGGMLIAAASYRIRVDYRPTPTLERVEAGIESAEATIAMLEAHTERIETYVAGYKSRIEIMKERVKSLRTALAAARASESSKSDD